MLAASAAAVLVACGGTDPTRTLVAVSGTSFAFPAGVASLDATSATTLAFTGTAAATGFSETSVGNTATGTAAFVSCIFVVTTSIFPKGQRMALGQTVTVNPCDVNIPTQGIAANSVNATRSVALVLGTATSTGISVTVGVSASGQLSLNGNIVSTIILTPVSGT